MPPDHAGKTAALADADDVHKLLAFKNVDQHPVAGLDRDCLFRFFDLDRHFAQEFHRRQIVLSQMSLHGLGQARFLHELDQADLRRVISVAGLGLVLRNHARTRLQNGRRMHVALVVEELRHSDFLAQNSGYFCHFNSSPRAESAQADS